MQVPSASMARRARRFRHAFRCGADCAMKGAPGLQLAVILPASDDILASDDSNTFVQDVATSTACLSPTSQEHEMKDPLAQDLEGVILEAQNYENDDCDMEGIFNFIVAAQQQKLQTVLDPDDDWMARLFYGMCQTPSLQALGFHDTDGELDDLLLCPMLSFSTSGDIMRLSAVCSRHAAIIADSCMSSDSHPSRPAFLDYTVPPLALRHTDTTRSADTADGDGPGSFTRKLVEKHVRLARDDDDINEALLQKLEMFWLAHPERLPRSA